MDNNTLLARLAAEEKRADEAEKARDDEKKRADEEHKKRVSAEWVRNHNRRCIIQHLHRRHAYMLA